MPPAQSAHEDACTPLYFPKSQREQDPLFVEEANFPESQAVQALMAPAEKVPTAQSAHEEDDASAANVPEGQAPQLVCPRVLVKYPALQLLHDCWPTASWYVPVAHEMQMIAFTKL